MQNVLLNAPAPGREPWNRFSVLFERWITARAAQSGYPVVRDALAAPDCYRGERLQFWYLFERFYVSRKEWEDSDFFDFLHMRQMAYADAVVTERRLVHCIREARRHLPGVLPIEAYDLSWLDGPSESTGCNL